MIKMRLLVVGIALLSLFFLGFMSHESVQAHKELDLSQMNNDGEEIYLTRCLSCHMNNGEGVSGVFPPVDASNEIVTRDKGRLIRGILDGVRGELVVDSVMYNGIQPPWKGFLSDEQIASLLTYVRNSFGNKASTVTAADVSCVREATMDRTELWAIEELVEVENRGMPQSGYVKVINNSELYSGLELIIQDTLYVDTLAFSEASSLTGFCRDPFDVVINGLDSNGVMEVLLDTTINPVDEETFVFVASDRGANGSTVAELASLEKTSPFSSSKDSVDVAFFNGYSDVFNYTARVYAVNDAQEQLLFTASLSFNQFTSIERIGNTTVLIELLNEGTNDQVGVYEFDLSEYGGETVSMVATGRSILALRAYPGYEGTSGSPVSTAVEEEIDGLPKVSLVHVAPNPFVSAARIGVTLSAREVVRLDIYDILGRHVHTLVDDVLSTGTHSFTWDATSMPSGMYLYRLRAGAHLEEGKMVLVR